MTRAITGPNVSIPRIFNKKVDGEVVKQQNPSFTVGSFICFVGFHNKSPELTIVGIIYMFEAFLTLDYGQFGISNLSPLFGLIPMLLRRHNIPNFSKGPGEKIIVEKVEK